MPAWYPANKWGGRHIPPARDHPHMPMTRVSDPASTLNDPIPPTVQPDGSRPPRVVIDTAVIVSALVFGAAVDRAALAWRHGYCRLMLCRATLIDLMQAPGPAGVRLHPA